MLDDLFHEANAVREYMDQIWGLLGASNKTRRDNLIGGDPVLIDTFKSSLHVHQEIDKDYEKARKTPVKDCTLPTQIGIIFGGSASGAYFAQVGVGGGWSVPGMASLTGSGSGATVDASVGYRFHTRDFTTWGSVNVGVQYFTREETFPAPFDDLKVRPNFILYQTLQFGPNFSGFNPGQTIAPYVEIGVGEGNIKVSTPFGSATQWNVGPALGIGIDYRLSNTWLLHSGVRTFFFQEKDYRIGGATFPVSERQTSATVGLIHEFWQR